MDLFSTVPAGADVMFNQLRELMIEEYHLRSKAINDAIQIISDYPDSSAKSMLQKALLHMISARDMHLKIFNTSIKTQQCPLSLIEECKTRLEALMSADR